MPAFFHNVLFMLVLTLGLGLGMASSVYAEALPAKVEAHNPQNDQAVAPPAARTETAPAPVRAELLEKLQDRLIELEKETAVLKAELGARVDGQDNCISNGLAQHGAQVTMLSNQTSMLGGLIALVTILVALAGYFSFSQAAKNAVAAARDEVTKESESWFARNDDKLRKEIDQLAAKASQACDAIDEHRVGVASKAEAVIYEFEQITAAVKSNTGNFSVKHAVVAQQSLQDLESKPSAEWTVDDFHLKALNFYENKEYVNAFEALSIQIHLLDLYKNQKDQAALAKALLLKGVILGQLARFEDELATYDDLLSRFGDSPEPALRNQVAKALFNKGVTLGQLNRPQEDIAVYDEIIRRFDESPEPALRQQVAMAMFSKGLSLGKHARYKEALEAFEELISRFEGSLEPVLRVLVARAMLFKGLTLDLEDPDEAQVVFRDIISRFGESIEPELREIVERARRKLDGKP